MDYQIMGQDIIDKPLIIPKLYVQFNAKTINLQSVSMNYDLNTSDNYRMST